MLLPPCLPQQCGKDFRSSLKQPSPNYPYGYKTKKPRIVPAFTIQSMQKNTIVKPPPKCNIYEPLPSRPTMFRKCYKRGEFPVSIEFTLAGKRLSWKVIWNILLGILYSGFPWIQWIQSRKSVFFILSITYCTFVIKFRKILLKYWQNGFKKSRYVTYLPFKTIFFWHNKY